MKVYPSWRYHKTRPPKRVNGPDEEGAGWHESPADIGMEAVVPTGHPLGTKSNMKLVPEDKETSPETKEAQDEAAEQAKTTKAIKDSETAFHEKDGKDKAADAKKASLAESKKKTPTTTR